MEFPASHVCWRVPYLMEASRRQTIGQVRSIAGQRVLHWQPGVSWAQVLSVVLQRNVEGTGTAEFSSKPWDKLRYPLSTPSSTRLYPDVCIAFTGRVAGWTQVWNVHHGAPDCSERRSTATTTVAWNGRVGRLGWLCQRIETLQISL